MAAVETLPETLAPGAPADTQEAARCDGAETPEVSPSTTLALLQAEMDSVVKSMSDLVKVKDEDKITPYVKDPESSGEVDVAKEQLDVLVKIQHDLKRQQVVQQATLTSQFLLGKMQETMSKLLTERSNDFERQRKAMMLYMEKESNLHQNSMDQIETLVEKVGTTLDQFTSSLTTLSATIKDLSADQRSQGRERLDVLGESTMKFKVARDCWNMYVPTRSPQRKRLRLLVGKSVNCGPARLIRKGLCHQTRALYSTSSVKT